MPRIVFSGISLLMALLVFASCSPQKAEETRLPYYNTPDFTPTFLKSTDEVSAKITHMISPFSFTNQHGKRITEKTIANKIHVANFFLTSCNKICPVMTANMKRVQQAFTNNQEVVLLSFSVTPWIDSVSRLQEYALANQITSPNWHLLTGNKSKIYNLARKAYFAEEDLGFTRDSTDFLHTEHLLLIDKNRRIRGIYNGTLQLEAEQLIADVKVLLQEKD